MLQPDSPTLLTPPPEEEEVSPYLSVWGGIITQSMLLSSFAIGIYILTDIFSFSIPQTLAPFAHLFIAFLPVILWILISLLRERSVSEPRTNLAAVFIISFLTTSGISQPFLDSLEIERWLTSADTFNRIIGYTTTVGIVQETLKYLIMLFSIWPAQLRIRVDSVAYAFATAIGSAAASGLIISGTTGVETGALTYRILNLTAAHFTGSLFVAYGLASVRFNRNTLLIMPLTLVVGALIHATVLAVRPTVISGGFTLGITDTRPLLGLLLPITMTSIILVSMIFLFNNAERRDREAAREHE